MALTDLERRIVDFIRQTLADHDRSPSIAEIGAAVDVRSRGTIHRYVKGLIAKQVLQQTESGTWRSLRLTEHQDNAGILPLMGRIAAGRPIEAIPQQQEVNLAHLLGGPDRYVLQVRGDSMIDAGILDGDLVIIRRRDSANDGDIIVALIDDEEATLKRLRHGRDGEILLIPENSTMAAMVYDPSRVRIQGILAAQLRTYP